MLLRRLCCLLTRDTTSVRRGQGGLVGDEGQGAESEDPGWTGLFSKAGRTQIAEVVPEQYKKMTVCTDSQRYELSAEQRQAAERSVADDKARTRQLAAKPISNRAPSAPRPARAASQSGAKRPTEVVTNDNSGTTWRGIFDKCVECFGPYRTTRGATKPEGFDKCNVVASPEPKCGPRNY